MKSMGFNCFMVCMALGRFSCDILRSKFGRTLMVRVGGVLACGGLGLVVLAPDLPGSIAFACVGFSITGMGLSTLIPTMFSSAGHIPGGVHAGTSIAIVSMFTNAGAICSSPLVGYLSESLHSMRLAFLCDAILLGIICPLSWGIPDESHVFKKGGDSATGDDGRTSKDE
jgi:MFS family permease